MSSEDRLAHARSVLAKAQSAPPAQLADQAAGRPGASRTSRSQAQGDAVASAAAGTCAQNSLDDPQQVARTIILRKLAAGPKTRHQLRGALEVAQLPAECIDQMLDRYTELGLIDDAEYASVLVRSKLRSAHHSRRALRQDLAKVGIARELADAAVNAVTAEEEEAAARAFVDKKLASMSRYEPHVIERRIVAALGRRGFPPGMALALVREALRNRDEPSDCG